MKIRHINCPYCDIEMKFTGVGRLHIANISFFRDVMPVSIYECPLCGKLEFFRYRKPKKL